MSGLSDRTSPQQPKADGPNLWAGPLIVLVILLVPTLILVFSNGASADLKFAGWSWSAPLWLILLATFIAGIVLGRLFGWLWRTFRRRRARIKGEAASPGAAAG